MAAASMTRPVYSVDFQKSDGTTYHVKDVLTDLVVGQGKDDLSEKAIVELMNVMVGSKRLKSLIALKDTFFMYADVGKGPSEVMRGIVWERDISEKTDEDTTKLVCHDNLIYFHNSKDNFFAPAGKRTEDLIKSIANKWGIPISYKYASISHGKLTFHSQSIADIFISILDEVKKQIGRDYVIRSVKGTIVVEYVGSNTTVYKIEKKNNAIATSHRETMDGMITQVLIVKAETVSKGKDKGEEETGKYLTVTSVNKNTDKYGTLQDILVKGKDDELSKVQEEANQTLKENAVPKLETELEAVDNPMIKKGHQVYVSTNDIEGYFIVESVEHDAFKNVMYLEVKKYE